MESTHDIDFTMWCLAPRRPVRIYAQEAAKIMKEQYDAPDQVWMIITMNDGIVVTIGGGWVLPPVPQLLVHLDRVHRHRGRGDG